MSFGSVLTAVVDALEHAGVPYMVTGSLASAFHGEPRATRDIDIVIDPESMTLGRLLDLLRAGDFYVDRDAAEEALRSRTQFNAIGADATKVDFIVRADRPFSTAEFARRQPVSLLGASTFIASAEDVILAKLEWAAATGSDRQVRDVAGILAVAGDTLDQDYLTGWAERLGVSDSLTELLATL